MIALSRIYAVDGVDTNITVEAENVQAALRLLEKAADELGAAPEARNFAPPPAKGKGGRPKKDAVTAKAGETTPALPSGIPADTGGYRVTAEVPLFGATFTGEPVHVATAPKVEISGPPVFAPPPPAAINASGLVANVEAVARDIKALVGAKNPAWLGNVGQTIEQILGSDPLAKLSDAQLTERLGQLRQYEDMLKGHVGG